MRSDNKPVKHKMRKRVEAKDDGRILIYYTFESPNDLSNDSNKVQKSSESMSNSARRDRETPNGPKGSP